MAVCSCSSPYRPPPARAGLVVSIASTTVAEGGTGELDVYLSSTASSTSPDQINDYAFTLQITPVGAGQLEFSASQGFGYLNDSELRVLR